MKFYQIRKKRKPMTNLERQLSNKAALADLLVEDLEDKADSTDLSHTLIQQVAEILILEDFPIHLRYLNNFSAEQIHLEEHREDPPIPSK